MDGNSFMKKRQIILFFICLTLVIELYNFIIAPHISNMLLNVVLSATCGGTCTLIIYKFTK